MPNSKEAISSIEAMLQKNGFRKRRTGIFTKEIAHDVLAWIGLNKATRFKYLEINMVTGLRFSRIEQVVHESLDETDDHLTPPTIAGNVGYVGPLGKYYAISFEADADIDRKVTELENALLQWGVPFFEENRELSKLIEVLRSAKFLMPEQTNFRFPVSLWLLGKTKEAADFVAAKLAEQASREDPAAERYRKFAKAFNQKVNKGTKGV